MKRVPILFGLFLAGMRYKVNERIGPAGIIDRNPVADDIEIMLLLQLCNVAKYRLQSRNFSRHSVIDEKFEDAIVIGAGLVRARCVSGEKRASEKGPQGGHANQPFFGNPAMERCRKCGVRRIHEFISSKS